MPAIEKEVREDEERDGTTIATSRFCTRVYRAYERRLAERGLTSSCDDENEPSADDLAQIENES